MKLNLAQVNLALERLVQCGFLKKENNLWKITKKDFTSHLIPQDTNLAKKTYQKQILELSTQAIIQQPIKKRDHSSMVFSINTDDLNDARKVISKFRKDMFKLFNKADKKNDVYQLQISLFSLTEELKQGMKNEN